MGKRTAPRPPARITPLTMGVWFRLVAGRPRGG